MKKSEENAYSTKFKDLTELKNFIGKELGLTSWMQMSQKKIDDFAEITDGLNIFYICKKSIIIILNSN